MDRALKLVLLDELEASRPPRAPKEPLYCIAFLDTARAPPPRSAEEQTREWDQLCESIKRGRVKDPEPWLIPSLRKEFLLSAPDMRPFSRCRDASLLTSEEWERTRLTVIERMVQEGPGHIVITMQSRSPCYTDGEWGETTWGHTVDCSVERDSEGHWKFSTCSILVIM